MVFLCDQLGVEDVDKLRDVVVEDLSEEVWFWFGFWFWFWFWFWVLGFGFWVLGFGFCFGFGLVWFGLVCFAYFYYSIFKSIHTTSLPPQSLQMLMEVEADCYWCITKLLDGIQDNYTFAQPGIQVLFLLMLLFLFLLLPLLLLVSPSLFSPLQKENGF